MKCFYTFLAVLLISISALNLQAQSATTLTYDQFKQLSLPEMQKVVESFQNYQIAGPDGGNLTQEEANRLLAAQINAPDFNGENGVTSKELKAKSQSAISNSVVPVQPDGNSISSEVHTGEIRQMNYEEEAAKARIFEMTREAAQYSSDGHRQLSEKEITDKEVQTIRVHDYPEDVVNSSQAEMNTTPATTNEAATDSKFAREDVLRSLGLPETAISAAISGKKVISQEMFVTLTQEQKNEILANPDLYHIYE